MKTIYDSEVKATQRHFQMSLKKQAKRVYHPQTFTKRTVKVGVRIKITNTEEGKNVKPRN